MTNKIYDLIVRNKGIAAVGVTTDIDGELRDYLLPDIGIDEFSGDSYSGDVQLLSVEFNEFICPGVATNIQVSLTNNGSDIVPFYAIRMMSNDLVLFENILAHAAKFLLQKLRAFLILLHLA